MSYPKKYRKLPVEIEAMVYDGSMSSQNQLIFWMEANSFGKETQYRVGIVTGALIIMTLEGEMVVSHGDYVIKGIKGEFYPCKPDIFNESYEEVTE